MQHAGVCLSAELKTRNILVQHEIFKTRITVRFEVILWGIRAVHKPEYYVYIQETSRKVCKDFVVQILG
jgi:hypothetical protein